ncbi:hypothetical protein Cob_v002362 [Colletotrichum orbiculare MAFF 240422]|uniref:Uncharacterized protein n=1 Tax=Colletotrichum orbiculare (strain 104-T / ATCC 96160 / CBS 514.97 / LARS 414 / MAFF 240422) TaxID=1213857 RepID=A0A484G3U6_COLOR|nr:hypothetical protein Cob_v002362 [Colletotrichum orbiculare MAFF 240422]
MVTPWRYIVFPHAIDQFQPPDLPLWSMYTLLCTCSTSTAAVLKVTRFFSPQNSDFVSIEPAFPRCLVLCAAGETATLPKMPVISPTISSRYRCHNLPFDIIASTDFLLVPLLAVLHAHPGLDSGPQLRCRPYLTRRGTEGRRDRRQADAGRARNAWLGLR